MRLGKSLGRWDNGKTHWTAHVKCTHFTVCKLCLIKVNYKKNMDCQYFQDKIQIPYHGPLQSNHFSSFPIPLCYIPHHKPIICSSSYGLIQTACFFADFLIFSYSLHLSEIVYLESCFDLFHLINFNFLCFYPAYFYKSFFTLEN